MSETVTLAAMGAPVGTIAGRVEALLMNEAESRWTVISVSEGIQLQEETTGNFLAVPDTDPYTQAVARSSDPNTPNSRWVPTSPDGDKVDKFGKPGQFYFQLAGTDRFIGRHDIEDRSLMPKDIVLRPSGAPPQMIIVRPQT